MVSHEFLFRNTCGLLDEVFVVRIQTDLQYAVLCVSGEDVD